jgi:hypothetical protein
LEENGSQRRPDGSDEVGGGGDHLFAQERGRREIERRERGGIEAAHRFKFLSIVPTRLA